jgi:hypothetical protein
VLDPQALQGQDRALPRAGVGNGRGAHRVVPLEPEFIVPQDGHEKQDCESRAAGWNAMAGAMLG